MARSKEERQAKIKEIVRKKIIKDQDELILELNKLSFEVTQATVSRDISEIGLEKISKRGYALAEERHLERLMEELVLSVTGVNNLILIKCVSGSAPGVAAALDKASWEEILGTIAGDDTIL
ncbi:MAG: ArgR family transcriptional regulator, partial [Candidatus Subteraquimicrobiales bacterium]|nr:ArgR family transcriptional regulator [Candidatus Subteraquimicrobiales bacterium]